MFKFKRLVAATAAAAMAIAGLALGTAPANAQGTVVTDKAQFAFSGNAKNQLNGHKLEYYKIGDYVLYGQKSASDENKTYGVRVASALQTKSPNLITSALNDALKDESPAQQVPSDVDDALAWAMSEGLLSQDSVAPWDGVTRKFVTYLNDHLTDLPTAGTATLSGATSRNGDDSAPYMASISLPAGIYMFRDVTDPVVENSSNAVPMLVASGKIDGNNDLSQPTSEASITMKDYSTELSIAVTGEAKTDSTGRTASRGETLTYTMNGYVPKTDSVTYPFDYVTTPLKGLKVDLSSVSAVIVDKDGKTVTGTDGKSVVSASDFSVVTSDDSTVTIEQGKKWFVADGVTNSDDTDIAGHTISVRFTKDALAKWQTYITDDYALRVSYKALVTTDAVNCVDNEFYVSASTDKLKFVRTKLTTITFKKVDASGKPLAGARFKIESSVPDSFVLPSGYVNANTNRDASCGNNEAISQADGTVTFDGLAQSADASYKITEVAAPSGYLTLPLYFNATVSLAGANVVFDDGSVGADPFGLVTVTAKDADGNNQLTVENVHSVAQLPLTGGAGIAFMVVVAALLATAGGIVVVRSRRNNTTADTTVTTV